MLDLATTLSVPSTYADGRQNYSGRDTAGVEMVSATPASTVGSHGSPNLQYCWCFVFKFGNGTTNSGLTAAREITSAHLSLHANNGNNTGLEYLWIGVENNVDPTKLGKAMATPEPDRFHDGTNAAGSPWSRLCSKGTAPSYFGRTGVVHDGDLTTNVGPRDTHALIYRAFVTPPATTREWMGGDWNNTNDFAPALNALLHSPGWNPDLQYVNVFMFTENQNTTINNTYGIGNLGSLTYLNGQDGTNTAVTDGGPNAGGQMHMAESLFPPKLVLTHRSIETYEPLDLAGGATEMRGHAYVVGKKPVLQMRGRRWDQSATGGVVPRFSAAAGDTPIWDMVAANPQSLAWTGSDGSPFDSKVKHRDTTHMPSGSSLILEGYAGKQCTFWMNPSIWPHEDIDWNLQAYSMRFYFQFDDESAPSAYWGLIAFHKALGTTWPDGSDFVWDIRLSGGDIHFDSDMGFVSDHGEPEIGGYITGAPPNRQVLRYMTAFEDLHPHPGAFRCEIQVDQNRNPKIRVRIYAYENDTIPRLSYNLNPTFDVSMGYLRFGKIDPNYLPIFYYGDIELHPNYNLSGEFQDPVRTDDGTPYEVQTWDWFELEGEAIKPLEDLGSITSYTGSVPTLDGVALTDEVDRRDVWNPVGYTKVASNVSYSSGACLLDRYRPNGMTGVPLPCAVYIHGGFFTSGDKNEPSQGMIDLFTMLGWEFVSINYTLSRLPISTTYPAWDASGNTARHPSHIVQAKLAVRYMSQRTDVDASRMLVLGHSAGAMLAGGVAYSRGLGGGGGPLYHGSNLTVSNTSFGGNALWVDPQVIGVLMLTAPVDLPMACAYDPSVAWPLAGVDGNIRQTTRSYMGKSTSEPVAAPNTELWRYVQDNPNPAPPSYYQQGGSDFLVHWRHWELLEEKLIAKGVPYRHRLNMATQHDSARWEFDIDDIRDWLETL